MQQGYLITLLLYPVTHNMDVRQLLDCPSQQHLEPPKTSAVQLWEHVWNFGP